MNIKNFMAILSVLALSFFNHATGFAFEKMASPAFSNAISLKNVKYDFGRAQPFFDVQSMAEWAMQNPAITASYRRGETEMNLGGQMAGYFAGSSIMLRAFAKYGGYPLSESELSFKAGKLAQLGLYWVKDWQQTLSMRHRRGMYEMNPVIGKDSQDIRVHSYFFGGIILLHYLAVRLPDFWADSLIDSIRLAEDMVTRNNIIAFDRGGVKGLPVALILTMRF